MGIDNYSVSTNHHDLNKTSFDGTTFKGTNWNNTSHVANDKNNGVEFVFGEGMDLKLNSRYHNEGEDVFSNLDKKHTGISFDLLDKFIEAADKGILEDVDHQGYTAENMASFGKAFDQLRKDKLAAAQRNPYSKEYTNMRNGTAFSFSASEIEMLYKAAGFDVAKPAEPEKPVEPEVPVEPEKPAESKVPVEPEVPGDYNAGTEAQFRSVTPERILNQIVSALGIENADEVHIDFGGMQIDDQGNITEETMFTYNGEQYVIQKGNVKDLKVVKQEVPNPVIEDNREKYETRYNEKTGTFQRRKLGSFLGIKTHKWHDVDAATVPVAEQKRLNHTTKKPAAEDSAKVAEDLLASAYEKLDNNCVIPVASAMYKNAEGEDVVTESGTLVNYNGKRAIKTRIGNTVKYYEPIVVTPVGSSSPMIVTGNEIQE